MSGSSFRLGNALRALALGASWVVVLAALAMGCGSGTPAGTHTAAGAPAASAPGVAAPAASAPGWGARVGFRSRTRLAEHFAKHGADMGAASAEEYLRLAQGLRDRPAGGDVLELKRADGAVCRFDRASGAFLAANADGTIRTFFKPRDGERYFERQAYLPHGAP
jgi:pyocin large subunit-like protein